MFNNYNVNQVGRDLKAKASLKKVAEVNGPAEERLYAHDLFEMGKSTYFDEYYFGIKLENQVFDNEKFKKFADPTQTFNFKNGYNRGKEIVESVEKTGITEILPKKYQEIATQRKTR